jgi:hypothetical protein
MIIGFSWGGWMTGGTANKLAAEQADTTVLAALTPLCVERFMRDSGAKANLAALQKVSLNREQGDYLEKGGWATPPERYLRRLPPSKGVCREIGPSQDFSPMS